MEMDKEKLSAWARKDGDKVAVFSLVGSIHELKFRAFIRKENDYYVLLDNGVMIPNNVKFQVIQALSSDLYIIRSLDANGNSTRDYIMASDTKSMVNYFGNIKND